MVHDGLWTGCVVCLGGGRQRVGVFFQPTPVLGMTSQPVALCGWAEQVMAVGGALGRRKSMSWRHWLLPL